MSFLAPLFLLGGLAAAGPLIFHLIRRTTRDVVPFSSLMFLTATPPRMTKRSRLENLWLLVLRVLIILLLALGFGRPLLQRMTASDPGAEAGKRTVILLDTSASMRREDLWPRAQAKLLEVLHRSRDDDSLAIVAFDRTQRTLVSFDQWRQAAPAARVDSAAQQATALTPGWSSTALGAALLRASELLNAAPEASRFTREIVVISDFQEGSQLEGLQGYEWPRGTEVALKAISPAHFENARADWVAAGVTPGTATAEPLHLRVSNEAGAAREQFQLRWAGGGAPVTAYVPAGQSRVITMPAPSARGGDKLVLSGDDTTFDNETFIVPPRPEQTTVLFLGNDPAEDSAKSLYFLRRAFPEMPTEKVEILARPGTAAPPAWELTQAQLLVLGEGVTEPALASARTFAESGRIVLLPLTSTGSAAVLGHLIGQPELTAAEPVLRDYAMLGQIDFQHPLFSAFADPRYSDFSKIHFWAYRDLGAAPLPGARVLARFDTNAPAILQIPLGGGSVVVFTSSWRPADSQLALSSKFVPLLQALLAQSSGRPPRQEQYFVGDPVPLRPGTQPWVVSTPGGRQLEVATGGSFTATDEPGLYVINPGASSFAVNLTPEESRTNPMPPDRLASLGVPLRGRLGAPALPDPAAAALAKRADDESRQKLWRWLIAAALVLLLAETVLAARQRVRSEVSA